MMHDLHCRVPAALSRALHRRNQATGEPIGHLVSAALAEYLDVEHHTLFQVSTSAALVEGVYQGAVRVGTLREHGDLGLGTFEDLDGEMAIIDGHCFQVRSDGSVQEVRDDVLSPFAVVTRFVPDQTVHLDACPSLEALLAAFDRLRRSNNVFFAVRVDGRFDDVRTRAMCKTPEGTPLAQAAATQPEFEFRDVSGTMVGFWTPEYAKTLNVTGYHLHFLSFDHRGGGHLLQCRGGRLRLQMQQEGDIHVALPATKDFLQADLTRDPSADLERAERSHDTR